MIGQRVIEPAGLSPAEKKNPKLADRLKRQFRELARNLTRRFESQPRIRRRREKAGRGFKAFATKLLLRVSHTPVFDPLDLSWSAFTWLRLWEYSQATGTSSCQDCASSAPHPTSELQL